MESYIIGTKNGKCVVATESEIINNALEQEKQGIKPHYVYQPNKEEKPIGNPGWLVWSSYNHGCGVVHRRDDGKMIIFTGLQGDFSYV